MKYLFFIDLTPTAPKFDASRVVNLVEALYSFQVANKIVGDLPRTFFVIDKEFCVGISQEFAQGYGPNGAVYRSELRNLGPILLEGLLANGLEFERKQAEKARVAALAAPIKPAPAAPAKPAPLKRWPTRMSVSDVNTAIQSATSRMGEILEMLCAARDGSACSPCVPLEMVVPDLCDEMEECIARVRAGRF